MSRGTQSVVCRGSNMRYFFPGTNSLHPDSHLWTCGSRRPSDISSRHQIYCIVVRHWPTLYGGLCIIPSTFHLGMTDVILLGIKNRFTKIKSISPVSFAWQTTLACENRCVPLPGTRYLPFHFRHANRAAWLIQPLLFSGYLGTPSRLLHVYICVTVRAQSRSVLMRPRTENAR